MDEDVEDDLGQVGGIETYPLNTLLIRAEPRVIADVLRRIEKGAIKLDPDFERDFVWDDARQSRLVESVLMRIPLPVFYLAEDAKGPLVVVDGLQRLTTFRRFYAGELKLHLPERDDLHGLEFSDLPQSLQDRFEDGPLMFYLIDPSVPDSVRLDIFERVNSGVPLTRQQMRNALYNGPATKLLRELASSQVFLNATGRSLSNTKRLRAMADREAVNRFVAHFTLGPNNYGVEGYGEFDAFLGAALRQLNESPAKVKAAKQAFLRSMALNEAVFGEHAFRKSRPPNRRSALNLALFEVLSVGLAPYTDIESVAANSRALRTGFYRLLSRPAFDEAISFATSRADNVHTRFRLTEQMLRRVLGDP